MQLSTKVNPGLLKNIKHLPVDEQERVLHLLKELKEAEEEEQARDGFMPFIKRFGLLLLRAGTIRSWLKPLSVLLMVT